MTVVLNGAERSLPAGATVPEALALLGAGGSGTAVAVNGEVVPRGAWGRTELHAGDKVEVLAAVQGG